MLHIVLDINGVLINRQWKRSDKGINDDDHVIPMPYKKGSMHVFIRPGATELLKAIASSGHVLIFWSSMTKEYMEPIVELLVKLSGIERYRTMSQIDCMITTHPDPKVTHKPLFLKDVQRVYERCPNTDGVVFIDDGPLKMQMNDDCEVVIVPTWGDHTDKTDRTLYDLISALPTHYQNALI